MVISLLLKKISSLKAPIKALLVLLLRKLGLFDFYIRHEPTFSKVYHFFRRFLVSRGQGKP